MVWYEEDEDDILSELNKQIIKSYEDMDNAQKKQYSVLEKNVSKREVVPFYNVDDDNRINNIYSDVTNTEEKKWPCKQ